jgi:uncharacterized protein (TIGR03663 family)
MHADEAVQATRFRNLWQQGRYVYNPDEFHGPTLIYATLPSAVLTAADYAGTSESTYRIIPVLFGIGLVALFLFTADTLGNIPVFIATLLAAISPAMVFYSRYYIHETLLAFFTIAAIVFGWRYVVSRKLIWCLLCGACIGLMQATKETAAIAYLAACLATLATIVSHRLAHRGSDAVTTPDRAPPFRWQHVAWGALVAVGVAAVLLSSFFTNPRGPIDGVLTYFPWLQRAGGRSPHIHPWWFYLHRLCWWTTERGPVGSEGMVVILAAIGFLRAAVVRRGQTSDNEFLLVRWLACYTLAVTVIYCAIPYKTPWCLLQFWVGMIWLAGVGAGWLWRAARSTAVRAIIAALLVVGAGHLGYQAYRASFVIPADVGNPYVYAQTSADIERLAKHLRGLAETGPEHEKTPVKVIWTDAYYWPLPWYLRRFENVQLWRNMPEDPVAPIVISALQYDAQLTETFGRDYIMIFIELRPRVIMQLWVEFDLWEAYLTRTGAVDGGEGDQSN